MKRAIALLVVQTGVILGWASHHATVRAHAPTFRVPLDPQDPYDLLRGRYFVLNPKDRTVETSKLDAQSWKDLANGRRGFAEDVLIGLCPEGTGYRVCAARSLESPRDSRATYWVRGHMNAWGNGQATIDLGLHRFFIPNRAQLPPGRQDGWELEVSYRPGKRLLPRRLWFAGRPFDLQ
jgi:uncharacterized membrane-anchored protein